MTAEYITDVAYSAHFYDALTPISLNHVAALNGHAPVSLKAGFTYCELGCGGGLSCNTLAAANPQGLFYGIDALAAHIAEARGLAQAGGLENVRFIEGNFTNLDSWDLPDFDFITLQGVWSWIDDDLRAALLHFMEKALKPGGIVMLSYNTLPGWAGVAPLREIMRIHTAAMPGTTAERAAAGLEFLEILRRGGAKFFADNPLAAAALKEASGTDLCFAAHEYLAPALRPFYATEVITALEAAGFSFAGSYPPARNYPMFVVPPQFYDLLTKTDDARRRETYIDFICNPRFRTDLYVKSRPEADPLALLAAMPFGTFHIHDEIPATIEIGKIKLDLGAPIYRPVLEQLAAAPMRLGAMAEASGHPVADVSQAVNLLAAGGVVRAFARETVPAGAEGFNRALLQRSALADEPVFLASTLAGTGVPVSGFAALLLAALEAAGPDNAAAWAWQRLEARGQTLRSKDGALEGRAAHISAIGGQLERLREKKLPKLAALGTVTLH